VIRRSGVINFLVFAPFSIVLGEKKAQTQRKQEWKKEDRPACVFTVQEVEKRKTLEKFFLIR